jgi:hypothetical protein
MKLSTIEDSEEVFKDGATDIRYLMWPLRPRLKSTRLLLEDSCLRSPRCNGSSKKLLTVEDSEEAF